MLKNSLFSSLMVGLVCMSLTVLSATVEKPSSAKYQVECTQRWSTLDDYKDQYAVSCDNHNSNTCDDRTCHMGGPSGTVDANPIGMQLFLDQCAKSDDQGKKLSDRNYRIFSRAYQINHSTKSILAFGFAQNDKTSKDRFFNCTLDQAAGINTRRVWCDSCSLTYAS
ncbi:hypothetical protein PTTG_27340 [Puccinia triticina 1-1 BBBD Race 1]|uniref:Cyanovirin-N domain-containing protein n=2 Tax=Puccinia triticina TaxID=208348 RepID=A0A180GLB4_PUCT1|nr:uncharacterized protein PtA15_6A182 [Puccinia triticina]OAV93415.1 hypothetical protein PTTG_27340 [Puccinia triticina 1-1 BBBD Race 1]WAQ85554.1 hypothetical protein PtA15_6A182 [Puccinia triticina]WAR55438.1 hypothetical protein PtB15_6B179 [Puccinia triticina]